MYQMYLYTSTYINLFYTRTKGAMIPHEDSSLSANEHPGLADHRRKSIDHKTQTLWQLVAIDKSPKILQEKIKK